MLHMEGEKKRKRTEKDDVTKHEVDIAVKEEEEETVVLPSPSEAEVDEFFAILRRMHVAVKYLQRSAQILPANVNAHGSTLTASPAGVAAVVRKRGLDLNTLPDGGD
ncbi:uncharacterized protein LOC132058101 [Lycium ferocissimum]|uniref:uncharacterized protein LOC132058101 n=1 Tax=Lycium ferocissimum TaxID=112874 RepID=UPI00281670DC|nr:uncharacterized protein LOC132058101 [Lycium ferocissimum]